MKKIITMTLSAILVGTGVIGTIQVAPATAEMDTDTVNQPRSERQYRNDSLSYRDSGRMGRQRHRMDRQEGRYRARDRFSRRHVRVRRHVSRHRIHRLRHHRIYP
jgi:hypothetical protein